MSIGGYKRGIYREITLDFFLPWYKRTVNEDSLIIIIIIMTIFNEETFSLKSGLQKGPRKLKIKNLQWIKMLKDAIKN